MIEYLLLAVVFVICYLNHRLSYWKRHSFPEAKFAKVRKAWRKIRFTGVINELHRHTAHCPFVGVYYFLQPILLVNDPNVATSLMQGDLFADNWQLRRQLDRWFAFQYIDDLIDEDLTVIILALLFSCPPRIFDNSKDYQILCDFLLFGKLPKRMLRSRVEDYLAAELPSIAVRQPDSFVKVFLENQRRLGANEYAKVFLEFVCNLYKETSDLVENTVAALKRRPEMMEEVKQNETKLNAFVEEVIRPRWRQKVLVKKTLPNSTPFELAEAHLTIPGRVTVVIPVEKINVNPETAQVWAEREQHEGHFAPTFVNQIAQSVIRKRINSVI